MSFLTDLADYLSTGGVGTVGTDLFVGHLPDLPDAAVSLHQTGGSAPARGMRASAGQPAARNARVQVVARAGGYAAAEAKVLAVYQLLEGLGDATVGSVRCLWAGAVQEPFEMGRDENGRPRLAVNFDVVYST